MINKHTLTSEVSLWLVLHDLAMDEKVRSGWSNFPSFALRKKVVNGSWAKKRIIHWITQNTDIVISLQEQNKTKEPQNSISEALHRQKKSRALGKTPTRCHEIWCVIVAWQCLIPQPGVSSGPMSMSLHLQSDDVLYDFSVNDSHDIYKRDFLIFL